MSTRSGRRRPRRLLVALSVAAIVGLSAPLAAPALPGSPARAADEPTRLPDPVQRPEPGQPPEPAYHLPAPAGTALEVHAGNGPAPGRTELEQYAFDFVAAEGDERFPVVAARGGTVIGARSGVIGGRCDAPLDGPRPACWREVNYVLIDHGDGTSALYQHLRRGQLPVRIGEVVSAGQPLGTAGSSGWTDHVGLRFAVQETPAWDVQGQGGWFLARSLGIAFRDADVLARRVSGVPISGDSVVSESPEPAFEPFRLRRRPSGLPAAVPLGEGASRALSGAYAADSADGYGLHFAPAPDQPSVAVRPLFGGELAFAGCAAGRSAGLGRTVVIRSELEGLEYVAVHGHLASIDDALIGGDPDGAAIAVAPTDTIGRFGGAASAKVDPVEPCADAPAEDDAAGADADDTASAGLFVGILRGATVTPEGEISGGVPVSPEPLVGERGYEGFAWWSGPLAGTDIASATDIAAASGLPNARWRGRTPAGGSHVRYGQPITLKARVRDASRIAGVRFRAWYPHWPQRGAGRELTSFHPDRSWRELALCDAPGTTSGAGNLCTWEGDARDARVSYTWDPTMAKPQPSAPWLPRARPATSRTQRSCVPVSLAVEVIDRAGLVLSRIEDLPLPVACDDAGAEAVEGGRVLYLDPLVLPAAPVARGQARDRGWPPVYEDDPLDGAIVWRDRSDNEEGFRIYARRHWFDASCAVEQGPWYEVANVPANRERYRPRHQQVQRLLPVPDEAREAPGWMAHWEFAVAAWNAAGESERTPLGGFVGGSEAFCDPGLELPPEEA